MNSITNTLIWEVKSSGRRNRKIYFYIVVFMVGIEMALLILGSGIADMGINLNTLLFTFFMFGFAFLVLIPGYKLGLKQLNRPIATRVEIDLPRECIHLNIEEAKRKYRRGLLLDNIAFEIETVRIKNSKFKLLTIYEIKTGTRGQPLYYEICEIADGKRTSTWREKQLDEMASQLRKAGVIEKR